MVRVLRPGLRFATVIVHHAAQDTNEVTLHTEPFCFHMVKCFQQLSALVTCRLHTDVYDWRDESKLDDDFIDMCEGHSKAFNCVGVFDDSVEEALCSAVLAEQAERAP